MIAYLKSVFRLIVAMLIFTYLMGAAFSIPLMAFGGIGGLYYIPFPFIIAAHDKIINFCLPIDNAAP